MTILRVAVEDDQAEALIKMLEEVPYVKKIEEEHEEANQLKEPETPYERIKRIQQEIRDKKLFEDIKDPVAWQREIRKEWEHDL